MVKNGYYENECFGLARDYIKVCQIAAFNTTYRTVLLKDLRNIIGNGELYLISLILDTEQTIRCRNEGFKSLKMDIGIRPGDFTWKNSIELTKKGG